MAKGYWITFYRSISDPAALAATPNLPDRPWTRLVKNIRPAAPLRLDFGFHESNVVTVGPPRARRPERLNAPPASSPERGCGGDGAMTLRPTARRRT
jgi:hypothetical protein